MSGSKIYPNYEYEHFLKNKHGKDCVIAGVDEVGRGCLAGPVFAAAACLHLDEVIKSNVNEKIQINDSKKLSTQNRKKSHDWLIKNIHSFGIGVSSVREINKKGIVTATNLAFLRAIRELQEKCKSRIDFVLIDGRDTFKDKSLLNIKRQSFIKGDGKILSISAASIIAKVSRDKYMQDMSLDAEFKSYLWHQNKGYGTKLHREAIKKFGPTIHHRELFLRKII